MGREKERKREKGDGKIGLMDGVGWRRSDDWAHTMTRFCVLEWKAIKTRSMEG